MKKRGRRLISLLLALVLAMAMSITALAAETDEGREASESTDTDTAAGSITVQNATVGQSYTVYRIFEYDASSGKYTATAAQVNFYLLKDDCPFVFTYIDSDGNEQTQSTSISDTDSDSTTYYVSVSPSSSDSEVVAFFNGFISKTTSEDSDGNEVTSFTVDTSFAAVTKASETITATSSSVVFSGLSDGYYFVFSNLGAVVTLDSVTGSDSVEVKDKNQELPDWEGDGKTIVTSDGETTTENSVNIGDTVDFQISINTVNYKDEKQILYYTITDAVSSGFTYVMEKDESNNDETTIDITVKVGSTELSSDKYTITNTEDDDGNITGFTLVIYWVNSTVDEDGARTYGTTSEDGTTSYTSLYATPNTITVTYSAVLNESASTGSTANTNTAKFTYTNADNETKSQNPEEVTTKTYTYAIAIYKIDEQGNSLAGATFELTDSKGNTIYLTTTESSTDKSGSEGSNNDTTSDGDSDSDTSNDSSDSSGTTLSETIYYYAESVADGSDPTSNNEIFQITSVADSIIVVKGLAEGTYTLTEISAPTGYKKVDPIEVEASIDSASSTTTTIYKDADGNVTEEVTTDYTTYSFDTAAYVITVVDESGSELPETGGRGTTLLYVIGIILILGAGVVLVARKRTGER